METGRLLDFLQARSINVSLSEDKDVSPHQDVVPMSDVRKAIEMYEAGTLEEWIDKMESYNPYFLNPSFRERSPID